MKKKIKDCTFKEFTGGLMLEPVMVDGICWML